MRSQALGGLFSRRPQGMRASTQAFRRRITRLGRSRSSASAHGHLTSEDGARESAHQTRARPQGSRGGMSADRIDRNSNDRAPRVGSSSGEPAQACRGRQAHRGHHLAPRPALVRAIKRGDWSCPRSTIAIRTPQARRPGTTLSASSADRSAAPFSGRSGRLELIHQQRFIVASQRGVIMRGRKRSGLWPPAHTPDVVSHKHEDDAPIDADAQTDAALLALVRLLARQAAREVFARTLTEADRSIDEDRE